MADQHIPEIVCDPGAQNEFSVANRWLIDSYNPGDWDGTRDGLGMTEFYSDTTGSQVEIVAPVVSGGIRVHYSTWQDIKNTGAVIQAINSKNLGNNSGIVFSSNVSFTFIDNF